MCQHVFYYTLSPSRVDSIKNYIIKFTHSFCKLDCFIIVSSFSQCTETIQLTKNDWVNKLQNFFLGWAPGRAVSRTASLQNIFERNLFLRIHFQLLTSFLQVWPRGCAIKLLTVVTQLQPSLIFAGKATFAPLGASLARL